MKKLKYICEGEDVIYVKDKSRWSVINFRYCSYRDDHTNLVLFDIETHIDDFIPAKKVLTNNKLNRKLYEGKYVIREGYLTVDMDEV